MTGSQLSYDRLSGVIWQDLSCHMTGPQLSYDRTSVVIWQDLSCHLTGPQLKYDKIFPDETICGQWNRLTAKSVVKKSISKKKVVQKSISCYNWTARKKTKRRWSCQSLSKPDSLHAPVLNWCFFMLQIFQNCSIYLFLIKKSLVC
jgi:hypothetical protein